MAEEKAPGSVRRDRAQQPALEEALAAGRDLWGEAAMAQRDGPSYEGIADLLPPLRYVNTDFRHYPLILSAPGARQKARWISDGHAVNARAGTGTWQDAGLCPVSFFVGEAAEPFGQAAARREGPRYVEGFLPVVQIAYRVPDGRYEQEVFAGVEPLFSSEGTVVFVRFVWQGTGRGRVRATIGAEGTEGADGVVRDAAGRTVVWHDGRWRGEARAGSLEVELAPRQAAVLAVLVPGADRMPAEALTPAVYAAQRRRCLAYWRGRLQAASRIETPEPRVNDACRALLVGTLLLAQGDTLDYSALNLYATTFQAECGDAVRALALYGLRDEDRRMDALLRRPGQTGISFHDTAFKLQMMTHLYWLTREPQLVQRNREAWLPEVQRALESLRPATGLLPQEAYCGDISTPIDHLSSNANLWRGLRDLGAVLDHLGERETARGMLKAAASLRQAVRAAVARSVYRDVQPPFVPVALFGEEKPYERLTMSQMSSYWNLMAPYILGSGVFGPEGRETQWILDTLHQRGGVFLGMVRFHQHSGLFANENAVDDLYGLRYVLELLRRDEVDRALVSFYGKLAHGMTRDTCIGAEGTGLVPLDTQGRPMYLPPNSAANALFLQTLRHLLIQDWDSDDDGVPDTLRLLFATPRRWLRDGASLTVSRAPTAFGPVSVAVHSELRRGRVLVRVTAPRWKPARMQLRLRLPEGWQLVEARIGARTLAFDAQQSLDLSGMRGAFAIEARVRRYRQALSPAASVQSLPK